MEKSGPAQGQDNENDKKTNKHRPSVSKPAEKVKRIMDKSKLDIMIELERRGALDDRQRSVLNELRVRGELDGEPRARPGTFDNSIAGQGLSGFNEGVANVLGAPVDLTTWALNKGIGGINAATGADIPEILSPVMGSESIKSGMDQARMISPESQDRSRQLVRRVGREVGANAIPAAGLVGRGAALANSARGMTSTIGGAVDDLSRAAISNPAAFAATEGAASAGAGLGAGVAQQIAPNSPNAELAGSLVGALGVGGAIAAGRQMLPNRSRLGMTIDDLRAQKDAAYKRVDDLGARYSGEQVDSLLSGISDDLAARDMDEILHPLSARTNARIQERSGAKTLSEIDQIRRMAQRNPGASPVREERANAQVVIDNVDEFLRSTVPENATNLEAARTLSDARDLASRDFKATIIQDAFDNAERSAASSGSGGNTVNTMRQAIRRIMNNPRQRRRFSANEQKMMDQFIKGSKAENVMRFLGKFSPFKGGLTAQMATGIGGLGAMNSQPWMLAPFAVGTVAHPMAEAMATRGARRLIEMSINGGKLPSAPVFSRPQRAALAAAALGGTEGLSDELAR